MNRFSRQLVLNRGVVRVGRAVVATLEFDAEPLAVDAQEAAFRFAVVAAAAFQPAVLENVPFSTHPLAMPHFAPFHTNEVPNCHLVIHNPEKPWEI